MPDSALPAPLCRPPSSRRLVRVLPLVMAAVSLLAAPPTVAGAVLSSTVPIYLNGSRLGLPAPTYSESGYLLVPLRSYVEAMGGTVSWEPPGVVTATLGDRTLRLTAGSDSATLNGSPLKLPLAVANLDGLTYAPLRSIGEALGARVAYDGQAVRVTRGQPPAAQALIQVKDGPLHVRSAPGTNNGIITTVPVGTVLGVLGESAGWIQVGLPQGRSGWVAAAYTQAVADRGASDSPADLTQEVGYLQFGNDCFGPSPIMGTTLYVPLQAALQRLGGQVALSGGTVTASYGSTRLVLTPGSTQAERNGQPQTLSQTPWMVSGQVLVPAHTLADTFGMSIQWDAGRKTAVLGGAAMIGTGVGPCNPTVFGSAYIVMDARTGLVLSERAADAPLPIASTTKIMTALYALEQGNLNSPVWVSRYAAGRDCTCVPLRTGDVYPLREMLYGLILPSGNDAASAIAEHISGSEWRFARAMTRRAQELGATHSEFYDASGLDDNGHSSARDLALIARQALKNPDFRAVVSTTSHTMQGTPGTTVFNLNRFLSQYPGATGVKNGWTPAAGHTLVASAFRGGRELIVVLLGSPTTPGMYQEAGRLMDRGYQLSARNWLAQL